MHVLADIILSNNFYISFAVQCSAIYKFVLLSHSINVIMCSLIPFIFASGQQGFVFHTKLYCYYEVLCAVTKKCILFNFLKHLFEAPKRTHCYLTIWLVKVGLGTLTQHLTFNIQLLIGNWKLKIEIRKCLHYVQEVWNME